MRCTIARMTGTDEDGISHPFPGVRLLLLELDGTVRRCTVAGQSAPRRRGQQQVYPGMVDLLNAYVSSGAEVVFVTCQPEVGAGEMPEADLHDTLAELKEMLGWKSLDIVTCTHGEDEDCECRLPSPKMLIDAMKYSGVGPEATLVVGDNPDIFAASRAAGAHRFFFSWMFNPLVPVADWFQQIPMVH